MAIRDDIAAIEGEAGKSASEKRSAKYALKVGLLATKLGGLKGHAWTARGISHRLNGVFPSTINGTQALTVDFSRAAPGQRFDPFDQMVIINPPIAGRSGKTVDAMSTAELVEFVRELMEGLPPGAPA